jgi:hypothetical protein
MAPLHFWTGRLGSRITRFGLLRRRHSHGPTPAVFNKGVIDMGPIGQKHIGKGASILVEAVRLERDLFAKDQL